MIATTTTTTVAGACALLTALPIAAQTADAPDGDLKARVAYLDQRYEQQSRLLQDVREQLRQLQRHVRDNNLQNIRGMGSPPGAYARGMQQQQGVPGAPPRGRRAMAGAAADPGTSATLGQRPEPSRSAQAVQEQAQGAVFEQKFTVVPSITYSHYDRRQIALSGFLVFDAIFLGSLSLDEVKSDAMQLELTGRWGVTPNLQLYASVPFLYRHTDYFAGGSGTSAANLSKASIGGDPDLGDIEVGAYYQLWPESDGWPSLVAHLGVRLPTGTDPYGIDFERPDPNNTNLKVPKELPTGNGVYSAFLGFSVMKTVDPVILFANAGVRHYFKDSFDDISSFPGDQPGDVDLGDAFEWGAGLALAVNRRMALTFSYSQTISETVKTRADGGDWQDVVGSSANASKLNLGLTYAFTDHTTMITNVSVGLTPDSPDYQFSLQFPYTF